jgi:hypothetical protein
MEPGSRRHTRPFKRMGIAALQTKFWLPMWVVLAQVLTRFRLVLAITALRRLLRLNALARALDISGSVSFKARHALFPDASIGRLVGCWLPDAILHGKRSCRPHSRAVKRLAVARFRVRPLSPLGLVVAPPACGPGEDTFVTWASRLHHLARGRPRLLAVRWPRATGLTSYLSGCLVLTSRRRCL